MAELGERYALTSEGSPMGMTMIEKILARAAGLDQVQAGEFVVCDVDMTVLIDLQFATLWANPDPDRRPRQARGDHGPRGPRPDGQRRRRRRPGPRVRRAASASSGSSTSGGTASATR